MIIAHKTMSVWALSKKKAQDKLDKQAGLWFEALIDSIKRDYKDLQMACVYPLSAKHGLLKHSITYAIDIAQRDKPSKVVVQRLVLSMKEPKPDVVKKTPKKVYKKAEKKTKKTAKAKKPARDSKGRFIKK